MCGIVGVFCFGKTRSKTAERVRQRAMQFLATELLRKTEDRGKDATGISVIFDNGNHMLQKSGYESTKHLATTGGTKQDYEGFMKIWRTYEVTSRIVIGHCRKSSIGGALSSNNNNNNHPIRIGSVMGVHNGTLSNHDLIIENLGNKRDGTVDSEAIVRLLNKYTDDGKEPLTTDIIVEVARRLNGSYSVLGASSNNPFQVAAFRNQRPMEAYLFNDLGIMVIGSTASLVKETLSVYNTMARLYTTEFPPQEFEYKDIITMPENNAMVINLTAEVDDKTKVLDLVSKQDMKGIEKIWQNKTSTTAGQSRSNKTTIVNSRPANFGRNSKTTAKNNKTTEQPKNKGMVWNRDLNNYNPPSNKDVSDLDQVGTIELSVGENESVNVTNNDKEQNKPTIGLKKSETSVCDTTRKASKATIIELPVNEKTNGEKYDVFEEPRSQSAIDKNIPTINTVDVCIDPNAIEAVAVAAGSLSKYESDEDVLADLEISSHQNLKHLPIFALCNRLRYSIFKQGFYAGFLKGKKSVLDHEENKNKALNATNKIRILKHVIKLMSKLVDELVGNNKEKIDMYHSKKMQIIRRLVTRYKNEATLDKNAMDVFSNGDVREENTLTDIVKTFRGEQ